MNFFGLFGEDPRIQCGWKWLNIYDWYNRARSVFGREPKRDPYIDLCEFDDKMTTPGTWQNEHMSSEEMRRTWDTQRAEIEKREGFGKRRLLGALYSGIVNLVRPLFK